MPELLLGECRPGCWQGLLYAGSGLGLGLYRNVRRLPRVRLAPRALPLAGAKCCSAALGPVLPVAGLAGMPASGFAAAERRRVLPRCWPGSCSVRTSTGGSRLGMAAIVGGADGARRPHRRGRVRFGLVVVGRARRLPVLGDRQQPDPKGRTHRRHPGWPPSRVLRPARSTWLWLSCSARPLPPVASVVAAMGVGLAAYGVSLVLFIVALRQVGTARAPAPTSRWRRSSVRSWRLCWASR